MSPPDGLLTSGKIKHDAQLDPDIIAWNPFASDDCLNAFPSVHLSLLTKTEELNTMNAGEDEPSSGLNGRLRPRKSTVLSPHTKSARRAGSRSSQDRSKRTSTPSKASPNKTDDLANKSDTSTAPHHLCPYCDRKFASKQTVSKHARRIHISASKQDSFMACLFCNHIESMSSDIIRHMVDSHPNQYFACLDCHTRFHSTSELAGHKLNVCEKQKPSYRSKLRQKTSPGSKKVSKKINAERKDELRNNGKQYSDECGFKGIVISCELKPSQMHDAADIEDNITTNLILPSSKNIGNNAVLEKNAVIVLDDIQWNKRIPSNFSFHNTDADQILSRLGVIHRSPRTGETTRRDWFRAIDDSSQKFEKCFDTSFYSKVASNVQENLAKFLDGSFNYNPDPDNTIKTRKSKNSVVINTAEGFPILLASEQYSRNVFDGYMPRAIAPKHKWKWDNLENDKNLINPDQIKRDSHVNNCIITLVSSLDIWTQLCMRQKFEDKFNTSPIGKKIEKRNIIGKQLKEILESRELPASCSQMVKYPSRPAPTGEALDFPASLGLRPAAPRYEVQPAVLSGEWVRPRCYVCCACGVQTRDARALTSHISTQHPNSQVQHYEIVGELLLNADILKHLYVPPSQTYNRTRPLRGFRECTKCSKSITLEDLHQHMLDCAGDTPTVRRKCRYRPFGVRRRRPRFPDNTIRKKIRKDIRNRQAQKSHMRQRPRPKTKTEVGDAETIRKMIADLPAKRHRVMVNQMDPMLRPRRKIDKQRNKMLIKRRSTEDPKTRRLRPKEANSPGETETPSRATKNQTITASNKIDEDNLPLRPRAKRVIASNARQNEALKRKAVLNRAKRRVAREKITQEVQESPTVSSGENQNNVLSTGNLPERIDVNSSPHNAREHSNRGGSNNRNDQPGSSRQGGIANNPCAPAQNAPLKHSIARLTANTETHDKSVQFHQLFLVQQECNSVTQHLPTQRQELFENEAVVTRLDKPPLHYPSEQLDPNAVQKSKINKPRKGLNDCIAMLKNKLVEPVHCLPTEHVSVQCGSDEPIDQHPTIVTASSTLCNVNMKPAEIFYRPVSTQQFIEPGPSSRSPHKPVIKQYNYNTNPEQITTPQVDKGKTRQKKYTSGPEKASSRQNHVEVVIKRKSTRRKSNTQSEIDSLKKLIGLPPQIEIIPQKPFELHTLNTTFTRSRRDSYKKLDPEIFVQSKSNDYMVLHKQKQSSAKTINKASQKKSLPLKPATDITLQIQKVKCNVPKSQFVEQTSPGNNKIDQSVQRLTFVSEGNLSQQKPANIQPQSSPRMMIPNDAYSELGYNNTSNSLSPTHGATNLEPVMSVPLDLSGKYLTESCSDDIPKQSNSYTVSNYDAYGTLDLSNKKSDCSTPENNSNINDVIVDLRTKPTEQDLPQVKIDIGRTPPRNESDTVTDLSMKRRDYEYSPTDLSIKGNIRPEFPVNSIEDISSIAQDLSGRSTNAIDALGDNNYAAQDLSRRFSNTINKTENINYAAEDLSGSSTNVINRTEIVKYAAEDLSGRSNNAINRVEDVNYVPQDLSGRSIKAMSRAEPVNYVGEDLSERSISTLNKVDDMNYAAQDLSGRSTYATNRVKDMIYEAQDLTRRLADVENVPDDANYEVQDLSGRNSANDTSEVNMNFSRATEVDDDVPTDLSGKRDKDSIAVQYSVAKSPREPKAQESPEIDCKVSLDLTKNNECAADLSKKISKGEQQELPKIFNTKPVLVLENSMNATELKNNNEKIISQTTPTRMIAKSPGILPKPVYDPTLKIPQYKIRVTTTATETITSGLSDSVSFSAKSSTIRTQACSSLSCEISSKISTCNPNQTSSSNFLDTSTQERNSYDFTPVPYNVSVGSIMRSLPVYTLPNLVPTTTVHKFENTKPVYTLTNACISVTELESTCSTTLTNSLLSVPGTTIANTTSVYTLAGTSSGTLINYGVVPNIPLSIGSRTNNCNLINSALSPASDTAQELEDRRIPTKHDKEVQKGENKPNYICPVDQDSETARKIAMLPKELIEILGTIPAGHRDQLLNVLPQYVSNSAPNSMVQCETSLQGHTAESVPSSKETDGVSKEAADVSLCPSQAATLSSETKDKGSLIHRVSNSETISSLSFDKLSEPKPIASQLTVSLEYDTKNSSPFLVTPPPVHSLNKNKKKSDDIKPPEIPNPVQLNIDSLSLYTSSISTKSTNETDDIHNKVIDLTEDENCQTKIKINKVTDKIVCPVIIQPQDVSGYLVPKLKKQKVNDQTASLRAVRIKAPSERHKSGLTDNQTLLKNHTEQILNTIIGDKEDNEAYKSSDSDKSLAIQQAEVSSTQHGSKAVVADGTFPVAISPTDLEASVQANNIKSLQILTPTEEIIIKKDDVQPTPTETPILKTSLVTSSIPANEINCRLPNNAQTHVNTASNDAQCYNEINKNSQPFNNISVVDEQDVIEITDANSSNASMESSTLKQDLESNKKSQQVILANNGKCSSEDDSEDDISLATIVKQKQRDYQVIASIGEDNLDNTQNKSINQRKKKENKLKNTKNQYEDVSLIGICKKTNDIIEQCKTNSIIHSNVQSDRSNVPEYENKGHKETSATGIEILVIANDCLGNNLNQCHTDLVDLIEDKVSNECEIDVNKENSNASDDTCKIKSLREEIAIENIEEKSFIPATSIEQELNYGNDVVKTDIVLKDSLNEDNNTDKIRRENVHISSNVNNTKIEEFLLHKGDAQHKKQHISNISKLGNTGSSFKTEGVIKDDFNKLIDSGNNKKIGGDTEEKEISTTEFKVDETNTRVLNCEKKILDGTITGRATSESNNNKTSTRTKKPRVSDTVGTSFVGDMKLCCVIKEKEKTITPLRRSRRGKSMFVDSSVLSDHDNDDNSDSLFEEKAPLTKKQLIFSKLLLDGENQSEQTNQSNIQINAIVDESNSKNTNLDVPNQYSSVSLIENIIFHDRCRSFKRKKSPQERRKWKKKKSLGCYQPEKDTDINNTLRVNETTKLVKYSNACDNIDSVVQATTNVHERDHLADQLNSTEVLQKESESRNDCMTDNVVKSYSAGSVNIPIENKVSEDTCSAICEKLIIEKRKLNISTMCTDVAANSKSKKTKISARIENINDPILSDNDNGTKSNVTSRRIENANLIAEIRTTCYNRPIAARRTRSKSVVVKSSVNEFYDPYDIDLDDMIEKTEPFVKKRNTVKKSAVCIDNAKSKLIQQKNSDNINTKTRSATIDTAVGTSFKVKDDRNIRACEYLDTRFDAMDHMMDSDDSSKSDVPLQKYVQEKEKKILEDIKATERDNEDDFDACDVSNEKQNDKDLRKSRRTLAVFNNVDGVGSPNETDEQLRSEQFMESFGFFSERKPRKSNLLASKKISETFHIIANESDDIYFGFKDRTAKRSLQNENRKSVDGESISRAPQPSPTKKSTKRGRKKKSCTKITPCYCGICKKEFRRPDNYLRHQMTLPHISKLSEVEMKVKTLPVHEEPNYLIVYKQHLDRLKILTDKLAKRKKNSKSTSKIVLPTMEEILADVNKTVREQQLSQRGLSRDEALFIDCCELLQEAHKSDHGNIETIATDPNTFRCSGSVSELDLLGKQLDDEKCDSKSDGDVDSITAKNILESEEVRNLENDLISGLKEAANANNAHNVINMNYQHVMDSVIVEPSDNIADTYSSPNIENSNYEQIDEGFHLLEEPVTNKVKKPQVKVKMYPDVIENIDMFEDKFDKIKRKCRSQAAAAKQIQNVVEPCPSHKIRKKSDKKKLKRTSKKNYQNTQVLTKGALKGFDGIKVSIPTSDINMSAIVPSLEIPIKKKRKNTSKKKRDKRDSESSSKYESDYRVKDSATPQRKVDVYEFMDNDDAELFEFRPSTLMERFKSISNKDTTSTSKIKPVAEELENSCDSGSDGDDFVYMSDDYVCSDDETENSLLSCELNNGKVGNDVKKNVSSMKRKDAVEKNAVMGKIFKHNAVRSEKRSTKSKDNAKPKANLDQLFDSLLEDEPSSSMLNNDMTPPRKDEFLSPVKHVSLSGGTYDTSPSQDDFSSPTKLSSPSPKEYEFVSPRKYDTTSKKHRELINYGPSTSKAYDNLAHADYGPSTSKKHDKTSRKEHKSPSPKKHDSGSPDKFDTIKSKNYCASPKYDDSSPSKSDDVPLKSYESKERDRSPLTKLDEGIGSSHDYSEELIDQVSYDDMGVARQRARRKCTVGKQNVLAETWSSESEPDGAPPRPASAESVMLGTGRRKKGKKKEGQQSSGRRANKQVPVKKQDTESRVSSNRNTPSGGRSRVSGGGGEMERGEGSDAGPSGSGTRDPGTSAQTATFLLPGPKVRPRVTPYYWSSEGDEEQEHLQQHGWIVGDSHKKLVTMLAHAKGRKRNGDDKRHLVE